MTPRNPAKLDCLDGLRGVAILLVIVFHLGVGAGRPYHPWVSASLSMFQYGYSGVHLFLVLSGCCLTHSLLRRAAAGRSPTVRSYLRARFWRIAPPYYASMAIYLAFPLAYVIVGHASPLTRQLTLRQIWSHLLFVHGLSSDTIDSICTLYWSLSLEFQFYLTLPVLFLLGRRFGALALVVVVAATSLVYRALLWRYFPEHGYLVNGFFVGRWTEFALGIGVAFWFHSAGAHTAAVRTRWGLLLLAIGLLGAGIGLARLRHWSADYLLGAGYAALLAAALPAASETRGHWLRRVLEWRPLVWVGTVSYSLYLTHSLVLERGLQLYHRFVKNPGLVSDSLTVVTLLAGSVAFGAIFYRLVERHFVRSVDDKPRELVAAAPAPETAGHWAPADERDEWVKVLGFTRGHQPVLLVHQGGSIEILCEGWAAPHSLVLAHGSARPEEIRRKFEQVARADMIVAEKILGSANGVVNNWPPESRDALAGCEVLFDGKYFKIYHRVRNP